MFVVWALARPEWHGSCTISHRFDSWKGPWQDGRGRSSDSICHVSSSDWFQVVVFFSLSLIVIVITSIAAQHFGEQHVVLTVFHEPQGRLHAPILGCSRHLRALRFLDGKLAKVFFQLFCPEIVQAWESHREYIAVHLLRSLHPRFWPVWGTVPDLQRLGESGDFSLIWNHVGKMVFISDH